MLGLVFSGIILALLGYMVYVAPSLTRDGLMGLGVVFILVILGLAVILGALQTRMEKRNQKKLDNWFEDFKYQTA
jgi:Ca2+/H+ antiporter